MRPSRSSFRRLVASVPLALTLAAAVPAAAGSSAPPVPVPETRTVDHVDDYAGVEVKDPYRWLEAMDDVEVRRWIDAQRTATADWIADVPERAAVVRRLESLMDHEDRSVPVRHGDRTFQSRQEGLANQRVLWVTEPDGAERPLIDPNEWSADGTVALREVSYRRDGRLVAIGKSEGGSDWRTLHVVDVDTGRELPDVLRWVKFSSPEWANDGESFYYGRYPTPEGDAFSSVNENQKLYLHRLGTDQSEDELVLEAPPEHPDWGFDPTITEDRRWLVVSIWAGSGRQNAVWVRDLTRDDAEFVHLFDDFEADRSLVTSRGDELWFRTDEDAPRQRILAIEPATGRRRDVLPEGRGVLQSARIVSDRLVTVSLEDVSSKLRVWTLEGDLIREVELPTLGTVGGVSSRESDSDFYFTFESFTFPGRIYRHDVRTGVTELTWKPDLDLDSERWVSEQVRYESRDGTSVPMFLVHDRDQARDGQSPVYLYGYGGFRLSMKPSFSASRIVWLEMGGIHAVANLRGGGEFGEEWHAAGMLDKKQNVFDDFISAAEYLVDEGWTVPEKIAIVGGSNGGLLTGACAVQRPDLFGAAIVANGVLDMLRYDKFTIGWAWRSEYGSSEDPTQFPFLRAYSPVHNVKPGVSYPAILVSTAEVDDRVVPLHSYKFAAALQAAQAGSDPVLLRVEPRDGHGGGSPRGKQIERTADQLAFLVKALDIHSRLPSPDQSSR